MHVNVDEQQKSAALKVQENHLLSVDKARVFYREMCTTAKTVGSGDHIKLGKSTPNSRPVEFHYSFDYAQQVHYPADPQQPGPIYFKTPRKCGIFGVMAEGWELKRII